MTDTVKMPEPYATLHHDDGYFTTKQREHTGKPFRTEVITMEQAKQYGDDRAREALEKAADTCDSTMYIEDDRTISKYGPMTYANVEIKKCADAIRALAKEIK